MSYDYSKLRGKIREVFGKDAAFAAGMDLSERSVSLKLNSVRGWKQSEIEKACGLLSIPVAEIGTYFFTVKVQCD